MLSGAPGRMTFATVVALATQRRGRAFCNFAEQSHRRRCSLAALYQENSLIERLGLKSGENGGADQRGFFITVRASSEDDFNEQGEGGESRGDARPHFQERKSFERGERDASVTN